METARVRVRCDFCQQTGTADRQDGTGRLFRCSLPIRRGRHLGCGGRIISIAPVEDAA